MAVKPTREDFKEVEATILRNSALIRELSLTFLGAGIQLIASLPIIALFVESFGVGQPQFPTGDQAFDAIYLSIGFLFAIPASLAFRPKRLINPFLIQLLTFVFGETVALSGLASYHNVFYIVQNGQSTVQESALQFAVGYSVLYLFLIMVVGFVQFFVVRWVVGLNGTEDDLQRRTFIFPVDYRHLAGLVSERVFRSVGDLFLRERSRGHYIILANNPNGTGDKIVLGVSADPRDPQKSLLATVAYSVYGSSVRKTEDSSAYLEANLLYLDKQSGLEREETSTDNEISDRTMAFALRRTRPSLGIVRDIPRYHTFALGFTFLLAIAMSLAYFVFKAIDITPYVDSLVLIAVAVVIEFGPLVRESLAHKEELPPEDY